MKTNHMLLMAMFLTGNIFSQGTTLGYVKSDETGTISRQAELECAPGSVFSQSPLNYWSSWFCDANDPQQYTEVIDDYPLLNGNIKKITCWMGFYHRFYGNCVPTAPITDSYQVNFYAFDNGNPSWPGAPAHSFVLSPTLVQFAGSMMNDYYRVEFTLPTPVTLSPGWVGISRMTRQDDCILMWYIVLPGGNGITGKQRHNGMLEDTGTEYAFCLESGEAEQVPTAHWAILLGASLIAMSAFFRFYRYQG